MSTVLVLHDEETSIGSLMEKNKDRFIRWSQGSKDTHMFKLTAVDKIIDGVSKGDIESHIALVNKNLLPCAIIGTNGKWYDRDININDEVWICLILASILKLPSNDSRASCVKIIDL